MTKIRFLHSSALWWDVKWKCSGRDIKCRKRYHYSVTHNPVHYNSIIRNEGKMVAYPKASGFPLCADSMLKRISRKPFVRYMHLLYIPIWFNMAPTCSLFEFHNFNKRRSWSTFACSSLYKTKIIFLSEIN